MCVKFGSIWCHPRIVLTKSIVKPTSQFDLEVSMCNFGKRFANGMKNMEIFVFVIQNIQNDFSNPFYSVSYFLTIHLCLFIGSTAHGPSINVLARLHFNYCYHGGGWFGENGTGSMEIYLHRALISRRVGTRNPKPSSVP
jgi:hypothetical protein